MIKRIGIVGGVGPLASVYFYERLLRLSGASDDADYPAAVLVSEPMPSRIEHLLGRGESPLPQLLATVEQLERAGADAIAIPSATTHAYRTELCDAVGIPVFDLLAETGVALRRRRLRRPLLLATEATAELRLYEQHLAPDTIARYPDAARQAETDDFIERVKRGVPVEALRGEFARWIEGLLPRRTGDPDCIVLACTELSVIAPTRAGRVPVVDVTDVLARAILAPGDTPSRPVRPAATSSETQHNVMSGEQP
ncbi:aspartate/glutamate racemase family protein [Embleya sp. NPDC055664]